MKTENKLKYKIQIAIFSMLMRYVQYYYGIFQYFYYGIMQRFTTTPM